MTRPDVNRPQKRDDRARHVADLQDPRWLAKIARIRDGIDELLRREAEAELARRKEKR